MDEVAPPTALYPLRRLDVRVAEHVMGWCRKVHPMLRLYPDHFILVPREDLGFGDGIRWEQVDNLFVPHGLLGGSWYLPGYSVDLIASWWVVERMHKLGFTLKLRTWTTGDVQVGFLNIVTEQEGIITDDAAPIAICRAALKALGQDDHVQSV